MRWAGLRVTARLFGRWSPPGLHGWIPHSLTRQSRRHCTSILRADLNHPEPVRHRARQQASRNIKASNVNEMWPTVLVRSGPTLLVCDKVLGSGWVMAQLA
jgi:hypothetical protein